MVNNDCYEAVANLTFPESTYVEPDYKEEGLRNMATIVRTSLNEMELAHIQFNSINKDTLLDAQKHPEQYPTLMVRVAGYSIYFNDLGKDVQDHVISRTEHTFR